MGTIASVVGAEGEWVAEPIAGGTEMPHKKKQI
jgi:hypothetical protein